MIGLLLRAFATACLLLNFSPAWADLDSKPHSLDLYSHQVEGITTANGSLIAFVVEADGEITYRQETAPSSREWAKRKSLDVYGRWLMPIKHADGRITIFIIGTLGNVLTYITQTAPNSEEWSKETELKGSYGQQIQPVTYADGRVALFFLDMGKEIGVIEETAANSGQFGKHKMLDLNGNRFDIGFHLDGSIDIAIIGTMAKVLTHATMDANGDWRESDIKGAYANDISFQNSLDGTLHLFFIDAGSEVARVDMSQPELKVHNMGLNGINIDTVRSADGSIDIIIVGTMANVLGYSRQVSPDVLEWSREKEMKGYAKWISPVETTGDAVLFTAAPFMSEVFVY
ncbi:MAG: hypothetical protein ACI82A_002700 [Candidatus Azotimanducaceae bacterium]|jgi:hypothetical protein